LVWSNFILLFFFIVSTYSRYRADPEGSAAFALAVGLTSIAFPVSLALMRAARYKAASLLSSMAMLANIAWMGTLLPGEGPAEIYRFSTMCLGAMTVNSLLALEKAYISAFNALASVLVCLYIWIKLSGYGGAENAVMASASAVGAAIVIGIALTLFLERKHSDELLSIARDEMRANEDKLLRITNILTEAGKTREIGRDLERGAEDAASAFASIDKDLDSVAAEARSLALKTEKSAEANGKALAFSETMRDSVAEQKSSLEGASASIHEIASTIESIGKVARAKQDGISALVGAIEEKKGRFGSARESVAKVGSASERVGASLGSLIDIAEKVNLLAMNASIEAAHSGSAGKGFAVIAAEMRSLSNQSRESAQAIGDTLAANSRAASEASAIIEEFTNELEMLIDECKLALDGIGEVLQGIQEIASGNGAIMDSIALLASIAKRTEEGAADTYDAMLGGASALRSIRTSSGLVASRLASAHASFEGLRDLVAALCDSGSRNAQALDMLIDDLAKAKGM
jgi:methyl-accepting chemotaxis protein